MDVGSFVSALCGFVGVGISLCQCVVVIGLWLTVIGWFSCLGGSGNKYLACLLDAFSGVVMLVV